MDTTSTQHTTQWDRLCPACAPPPGQPLAVVHLCTRINDVGELECSACRRTFELPDDLATRGRDARHPFERFARHGALAATWGRSECLVKEMYHSRPVDPDFGEHVRGRADDALDAAMRDNANRIAALWATLDQVRSLFEAESSKVVRAWLGGVTIGLIESMRERGCNPEEVVDAIRMRGGDPSLLERVHIDGGPLRARIERPTPFASLRHALAAARGVDADSLLGAAPLGHGGVKTTGRIPRGVVFSQMALDPTRSGTHQARGEGVLVARADARAAIDAARINGRPLLPIELELLVLVEVGLERAAAVRTKAGEVILAVEPLKLITAIHHLRSRYPDPRTGEPRLPTEHEASRMLARARMAVLEQLLARELVPRRSRRRRLAAEAPAAVEPIEPFQPPELA